MARSVVNNKGVFSRQGSGRFDVFVPTNLHGQSIIDVGEINGLRITGYGWQDFADTGVFEPAITDVAGGAIVLTNDSQGTQTDGGTNTNANTTMNGVTDIWNSASASFDFAEASLRELDVLQIRFDFQITPNVVPIRNDLVLQFYDQPGGGRGSGSLVFSLPVTLEDINVNAGIAKNYLPEKSIFIADSIVSGSMELILSSSGACSTHVNGWFIQTFRR